MAIQVELTAEEEAVLREQAAARGEEPGVLAGEMVRSQLHHGTPANETLLPVLDDEGVFHPDRFEAVMNRIAARSGKIPVLPAEALTREVMYQDHD